MGNMMQRFRGPAKGAPQQGGVYPPAQGQQFVQQQPIQYAPQAMPMQMQQPVQYRPQVMQMQQQPMQYRPQAMPMQQPVPFGYGGSSPYNQNASASEDMYLSSVTGLPNTDVGRLRNEFFNYANPHGVIDREGFRKLYIASLLNMTWEQVERDAETAFRNFDANQTGTLDFKEYLTSCSRMLGGNVAPSSTYPSYQY